MMNDLMLDQLKYSLQRVLNKKEIDAQVDASYVESIYGEMAYQLSVERVVHALRGEKIVESKTAAVSVEVSATAGSAFRLMLGWRWLLWMWPAKMRTVADSKTCTIEAQTYTHVCPHLPHEKKAKHVHFFYDDGLDIKRQL